MAAVGLLEEEGREQASELGQQEQVELEGEVVVQQRVHQPFNHRLQPVGNGHEREGALQPVHVD